MFKPINTPINMSQFSGFVSIPEASQTLKKKKVKPITIVGLNTRLGFSEEKNNKIIDLNNRVQAIRAYLKQRGQIGRAHV